MATGLNPHVDFPGLVQVYPSPDTDSHVTRLDCDACHVTVATWTGVTLRTTEDAREFNAAIEEKWRVHAAQAHGDISVDNALALQARALREMFPEQAEAAIRAIEKRAARTPLETAAPDLLEATRIGLGTHGEVCNNRGSCSAEAKMRAALKKAGHG